MPERKDFEPGGKHEFEIKSAHLLIADPFYLGYPRDIRQMLDAYKKGIEPFETVPEIIVLENGLFYCHRVSCEFNVFQNSEIRLIDQGADLSKETPDLRVECDSGSLLIGDASVFSMDESHLYVPHNENILADRMEEYRKLQGERYLRYGRQVLNVPEGLYVYQKVNGNKLVISPEPVSK